MEKVFEYKIEVDTTEVDAAKVSVKELQDIVEKGSSKASAEVATQINTVGQAAKETGNSFTKIGTTGKTAFTSLGKGLKSLTGVTQRFGIALKANPLFTLVAVITPILLLLKDMLDKFGLLTIATDVLSAALNYLLQIFKDLSDWLGFTDFAGEEGFEKATEAAKAEADEIERINKLLEEQVAARAKLLRAQGKNAEADELEQNQRVESYRVAASIIIKEEGILQERISQLKNKYLAESNAKDKKALAAEIAEKIKAQEELNAKLQTLTDNFNAVTLEDYNKRQAQIAKDEETALKNAENAAAKAKAIADRAAADERARQEYSLRTSRMIEDLKLEQVEESIDKEIELNQIKYQRLRDDTLNNEKLTQEQKDALIAEYTNAENQKLDQIRQKESQKKIADELRLQELDLELQKMRFAALDTAELESNTTSLERKLQLIRDSYAAEQELLDEQKQLDLEKLEIERENELISEEEFLAKKALLNQKYANDSAKLTDDTQAKEQQAKDFNVQLAQEEANAKMSIFADLSNVLGSALEENAVASKGIAAAQTLMSTYQAAMAAYASGAKLSPIYGGIAAGAAIVAGLLNVKKILTTDPTGGNVSTSAPSAPPMTNASAASIPGSNTPNFFGTPNPTGGDSSQFAVKEADRPEPIRAIVSWSDIDAVSNSDRNIRQEMQL